MSGGSRLIAYYMMLGVYPPGPTPPTTPRSFNGKEGSFSDINNKVFYERST